MTEKITPRNTSQWIPSKSTLLTSGAFPRTKFEIYSVAFLLFVVYGLRKQLLFSNFDFTWTDTRGLKGVM